MLIRKSARFRIYPTKPQHARLLAWEHALRFLWNLALEQRRQGLARPRDERKFYTAFDQINELTELRGELPWLAEVPRNVCAQLLVELDKAWQRCFQKLAAAPRFKRKGRDQVNVCEPHPKVWRLSNGRLRFPKLGEVRVVTHRALVGTPKTCTLVRETDQWFVAIVTEQHVPDPPSRTEPTVALDRGVVNMVADSDGRLVENPRHLRASLQRLARAQRTVARRKKGSSNREKAKLKVAKLHRTIRRQREHVLHELSNTYAKSHGTVIVEKLAIGNMVRSARGSIELPGRHVAAKSGLNRSILDAGWGRLVAQLRYKLTWNGGRLIEVGASYSSQTCLSCGCVDADSRPTQARFACTSCGYEDHADLNAAKILLTRGNASCLPAPGSKSAASRKVLRVPRRAAQSLVL